MWLAIVFADKVVPSRSITRIVARALSPFARDCLALTEHFRDAALRSQAKITPQDSTWFRNSLAVKELVIQAKGVHTIVTTRLSD